MENLMLPILVKLELIVVIVGMIMAVLFLSSMKVDGLWKAFQNWDSYYFDEKAWIIAYCVFSPLFVGVGLYHLYLLVSLF